MNRTLYFNYIVDKIGILSYNINQKGKLNILDLHNHSENFYSYFLSKVFGWELVNLNPIQQNIEAIDLIDHKNKIVLQVSATNTKQKLESSLSKKIISKYSSYTFKFVLISKESTDLIKGTFLNPHKINFKPASDIIDNKMILNFILSTDIEKQKEIYQLVQKELGNDVDIVKLDSNLAIIINILSKENLALSNKVETNSFEIDRKITHNSLVATKSTIEDYAMYYGRLDKKYAEFDTQGSNKSLSVLQSVNSSFVEISVKHQNTSSDYIFLQVIENVKEKVVNSANFIEIPIDELELCVKIIVVDAFIRCKIFENPLSYNYANS
ncbi:hypothetical protein IA01_09560 [Flavobacterium psychrophilum]|uniref:SMEK domain-containing protein n=5 Tax=Flavobacterium psychrophilum TaxID=96345 RepID=A6H0Y9_FLAPJ|nr:ABC-three component system protein [Flavobacterium psychrophilum]AIG30695.1 hypothetical protein IA03_09525 [Flavobacterium psychrophilum]AIG32970.1 hypothetical protein IA01_09560 [Flavobacterium psychrophilum]AIG35125.1 hypothetical protein IA02_08945 [Flavobacterium psychrophilum]AIG37490.1 hypothetical protein IA04_09465 [Flavobacterium psychrophilum]AIG39754.1 hypothetical protein IA05_09535 [Flavobacterium psychrophilum]